MLIKCIPVGNLETNCYVAADEATLDAVVIDPGDESNAILDYIEETRLKVQAIFLTHGHYDHTGAVRAVAEETGAPVWLNERDEADAPGELFRYYPEKPVQHYKDGSIIHAGSLLFGVLETPGHSPGSVTLMCEKALFTGDTLFRSGCGRTDLPGGSPAVLSRSLTRLYTLEGDYEIYPGHMDSSTLDRERRFNPFLRAAAGVD